MIDATPIEVGGPAECTRVLAGLRIGVNRTRARVAALNAPP